MADPSFELFLLGIDPLCDCLNAYPVGAPHYAIFQLLLGIGAFLISTVLSLFRRTPQTEVNVPEQERPGTGEGEEMIEIYGTEKTAGITVWSGDLRQQPLYETTSKK